MAMALANERWPAIDALGQREVATLAMKVLSPL